MTSSPPLATLLAMPAPKDLDMGAAGRRIAVARAAAGLSQGEAAKAVGVHLQTWSKWERGVQPPDSLSMFRICRLLRCSADGILGLPKIHRKG